MPYRPGGSQPPPVGRGGHSRSTDLRGEPVHQMWSRRFPLISPRQRKGRPHALIYRGEVTATPACARAYIISMRAVLLLAAACTLAAAQDPREIVRRSVQLMDHNLAIARNYTFLERSETRELDSGAHVKTRKILLYDVTMLEGSPYRRLVGKDDHALSPEEERTEQKKLADSIAQRQKETPAARARRIADWEKKRQREREPLDEVPDAFNFQITGEGQIEAGMPGSSKARRGPAIMPAAVWPS